MLRALANPARFRIVELLAERKDCTLPRIADVVPLVGELIKTHTPDLVVIDYHLVGDLTGLDLALEPVD